MKVIKFSVQGLLNSFRIPDFQTYQKTLMFPPKTTVCGMIGAALDWSPQEVNEKIIPEIEIAICIKNLIGPVRDLWKIQKIIQKADLTKPGAVVIDNHTYYGAVMIRELLSQPHYIIYLKSRNQQLLELIFEKLQNPAWALSLGHDDELVLLKNLQWIEIIESQITEFCDTVLPFDISGLYKIVTNSLQAAKIPQKLTPPLINNLPVRFHYEDNERVAEEFQTFSVLLGLNILLKEPVSGFFDGERPIIFF